MIKKITLQSLFLFCLAQVYSQNPGTYDVTFSGDGKEIYTPRPTSKPHIFYNNNEYVAFTQSNYDNGLGGINQVSMIKYDYSGNLLSYKVLLSDSAIAVASMKEYDITDVKQTTNGQYILATYEPLTDNSGLSYTPYSAVLRRINANGTIDATFGVSGRRVLVSDTIFDPDADLAANPIIGLYSDNSIFSVHDIHNTNGNIKTKIYKVSAAGVITTTAVVGTGSFDYYTEDVYVNSNNSVFLCGATNYNIANYGRNFVFKLTSGFNYDVAFNTTGKLFTNKGNSIQAMMGSQIPLEMGITTNGTDIFTQLLVEDTLNFGSKQVFIQQHNASGAFVAEKKITDPNGDMFSANGISIDNSGKVIALEDLFDTTVNIIKTYVVRLNPTTLSYDNNFNSNGRKAISFTTGQNNYSHSFLIHADDKIVLASYSDLSGEYHVALARLNGSLATEITDIIKTNHISIYPNPASEILHIKSAEAKNYPLSTELYDVKGTLIQQIELQDSFQTIPVNELAAGLYILKMYDSEKQILATERLMIQR